MGLKLWTEKSEEIATEQKFHDGMLSKMSKITDLISRLDVHKSGEDRARVQKWNPQRSCA